MRASPLTFMNHSSKITIVYQNCERPLNKVVLLSRVEWRAPHQNKRINPYLFLLLGQYFS